MRFRLHQIKLKLLLCITLIFMSVAYAYIEPEPTLFFLFAVEERIQHVNIWGRFFNNPNTTDTLKAFKILVHSRSKNRTREHLIGGYPFRPRNVKRIGSAPHNVHHVHMNLLKSALGNSTHYNDKFMLISHNAVPIKTMKEMRAALFQHSGSDICMLPTHHWIPVQHLNRISYNNSLYNIAVPASHEWMVLNKPDAIRIVKVYPRYSELPSMVRTSHLSFVVSSLHSSTFLYSSILLSSSTPASSPFIYISYRCKT